VARSLRLGASALVAITGALVVFSTASARQVASGTYGGTLYVGLTRGEPDNLDPTTTASVSTVDVFRAICERLYDFDARGRVVPELASALPMISNDKRTYTIPLRQGVEFNDGTPFDAQAVVTTLDRDLTLPGSGRASDLSAVDSVTAKGPQTVVIHLAARFTSLLANLATNDGIIMSPTQLAKLGGSFGSDPVCVGPFAFDHRVPGDNVTVIKSHYYYDQAAVHLDKIVFKVENDAAAAVAALRAGDIQMLDSVDPTELSALAADPDVHLIKQDSLGWHGISVNIGNKNGVGNLPYTNPGSPLASSANLRQAFEEAIDRTAYVKVLDDGAAVPDCTAFSPASPYYDPSVECTAYNPAGARKLVTQSGFPNPTVHMLVRNLTPSLVEAQFIQAEEAAIGINVVIDAVDNGTYLARLASGSFDTAINGWTGSPATDRNIFQFVATSGSMNYSGYSNPRLDLVLANSRKASSRTALKKLYHAASEILLADRPIIFLDHPIVYAAVSTSVKGVEFLSDLQPRVDFAQYP
jgi:peptide/nickel transport system substrate-binding protein